MDLIIVDDVILSFIYLSRTVYGILVILIGRMEMHLYLFVGEDTLLLLSHIMIVLWSLTHMHMILPFILKSALQYCPCNIEIVALVTPQEF